MQTLSLNIIDNHYDGIGDAVTYCWLAHSAKAAGQNVRLNIRKHQDIAYMFGQDDLVTVQPGPRWLKDKGNGSQHWGYEVHGEGFDKGLNRFQAWAHALGLGVDLEPVRPPYVEFPECGDWGKQTWEDRAADTGKKGRILIYPECAWVNRQWPRNYWIDLAWGLWNKGYNVVAMLPGKPRDGEWPYAFWGIDMLHGGALMKRADLVIANDSGPAHIAGTLDVRTIAICGLSQPGRVFGHMDSVVGVHVAKEVVECVGCHFRSDRGFRAACQAGCAAMMALRPQDVMEHVIDAYESSRGSQPEGRGGPAEVQPIGGAGAEGACGCHDSKPADGGPEQLRDQPAPQVPAAVE